MCALREHVHTLLPRGMSVCETKELRLDDLYVQLEGSVQHEFGVLGMNHNGSDGVGHLSDTACIITIRKLIFDASELQFISRFMPYLASSYALSIKKRNLSMDVKETFEINDRQSRSQMVLSTVNTAYFLLQRCGACGGQLEHNKKTHSCSFFCVAACQMASTHELKNVVAYVEYNILASAVGKHETKNTPCVSVHVITPSRLLSACYGVIDTLQLLLRCTLGVHYNALQEVPFPRFLSSLSVDVMCVSNVIAFYMQHAVPLNLGERKRAAIAKILLATAEYMLRTSVLKPMIVPFVMARIENPDTDQYYVQTPMRCVVQIMQKSRIKWPLFSDTIQYPSAAIKKEVEIAQLLSFLAPFQVCRADLAPVFREWTSTHAETFVGHNIQKQLQNASLGVPNTKLNELLYAVRCFFDTNQQIFYREELHIMDFTGQSTMDIRELELRFLLMLFRGGLSRNPIQFEPKDVCDVICPVPE